MSGYINNAARILECAVGAENIDVNGDVVTVFVDADKKEDITTLAHILYLTEPRDEIADASGNRLRFVEVSDDEFADMEEVYEDEEPVEVEVPEELPDEEEDEEETIESPNAIDDDGRALKVLTTAEMHKFASKIFTSMLGNTDMSRYPAFLMDLDRFLAMYQGDSTEEPTEEMASIIETAKRAKSARSQFLSLLMSAMSSSDGMAAINEFSAGNADKFASSMGNVVATLMSKMSEDSSDEE